MSRSLLGGPRRAAKLLSQRSMTSRFTLIVVIFRAIQAIILALSLVAIEGINATPG